MASKAESIDYLSLYSVSLPTTAQDSLANVVVKMLALKKDWSNVYQLLRSIATQTNYCNGVQHRTHQAG